MGIMGLEYCIISVQESSTSEIQRNMKNITFFLVLLVFAAAALAQSNEDEIQKAFGTQWQFKANRYCDKRQILKKLKFSSLKKAKKECAGNPECTMVVGVNCEKSKMFNLCKGVSRSISPKLGSCAYYNLQRYDADDLKISVRQPTGLCLPHQHCREGDCCAQGSSCNTCPNGYRVDHQECWRGGSYRCN